MTKYTTLVEALNANATPDRSITFIEGKSVETVVSYAELQANALGLLHHLQQRGVSAGDEVILFLKNNQAFIEMFWACVLGGMVPVPVAPGISDEHKAKLLRIECAFLCCAVGGQHEVEWRTHSTAHSENQNGD